MDIVAESPSPASLLVTLSRPAGFARNLYQIAGEAGGGEGKGEGA
jgi:hypothetical protein